MSMGPVDGGMRSGGAEGINPLSESGDVGAAALDTMPEGEEMGKSISQGPPSAPASLADIQKAIQTAKGDGVPHINFADGTKNGDMSLPIAMDVTRSSLEGMTNSAQSLPPHMYMHEM
ncbi:MAG: hypothetical protein ACI9S8_002789 [Chlamydiales bacterium]|jgi:hypothetical protein